MVKGDLSDDLKFRNIFLTVVCNSLEFLHEGAMMGNVLPETLEDRANMVPYCELIVELAGGAGMLDI